MTEMQIFPQGMEERNYHIGVTMGRSWLLFSVKEFALGPVEMLHFSFSVSSKFQKYSVTKHFFSRSHEVARREKVKFSFPTIM